MTIITHTIFSVMLATSTQASVTASAACVAGAILPDIDNPNSIIGRILPFISYPLNQRCGHRRLIHSFILYTPLLVVGIVLQVPTMQWIALGAFSHILIDCLNIKGVQAFMPFSEKIAVCFKQDWRIYVGGSREIIFSLILLILLAGTHYANTIGGPRKLINLVIRSPQIMAEEYHRAGNHMCWAKGSWRWKDGQIETVKWLIVGSESTIGSATTSIVLWNNAKLIRAKDGEFLRSTLVESQIDWPLVKVTGILQTERDVFFQTGAKWNYARSSQKVTGIIKTITGNFPEVRLCKDKSAYLASSY